MRNDRHARLHAAWRQLRERVRTAGKSGDSADDGRVGVPFLATRPGECIAASRAGQAVKGQVAHVGAAGAVGGDQGDAEAGGDEVEDEVEAVDVVAIRGLMS